MPTTYIGRIEDVGRGSVTGNGVGSRTEAPQLGGKEEETGTDEAGGQKRERGPD